MKKLIFFVSTALLAVVTYAQGTMASERADGPCVHVTVQTDRVNDTAVRQNCERNASRTVQLGVQNTAHTVQAGRVNDNKIRQLHFDRDKYFPQRRSHR